MPDLPVPDELSAAGSGVVDEAREAVLSGVRRGGRADGRLRAGRDVVEVPARADGARAGRKLDERGRGEGVDAGGGRFLPAVRGQAAGGVSRRRALDEDEVRGEAPGRAVRQEVRARLRVVLRPDPVRRRGGAEQAAFVHGAHELRPMVHRIGADGERLAVVRRRGPVRPPRLEFAVHVDGHRIGDVDDAKVPPRAGADPGGRDDLLGRAADGDLAVVVGLPDDLPAVLVLVARLAREEPGVAALVGRYVEPPRNRERGAHVEGWAGRNGKIRKVGGVRGALPPVADGSRDGDARVRGVRSGRRGVEAVRRRVCDRAGGLGHVPDAGVARGAPDGAVGLRRRLRRRGGVSPPLPRPTLSRHVPSTSPRAAPGS